MWPDDEKTAENTAVLSRTLKKYGRISARQNRVSPCQPILAIAVGQGNPYVRKEIHGAEYDNIGFWSHYHAGGHKGGHIFYV